MWYDVHIMLKTTFGAYKARFKELMTILKSLIIVQSLLLVLTILSQMFIGERNYLYIIIFAVLTIIVSIIQWLIYAPAAFRTIQKRELGEAITVEQGISFQKTDKWNYFLLSIMVFLFTLATVLPFFLPSLFLYFVGPSILLTIIIIVSFVLGAVSLYVNLPKVIFVYNIYFAKNLQPKDNFVESVNLGRKYRNTIWVYILGVIVINILGVLIMIIPGLFNQNQESIISTVWSTYVGVLLVTPLTYLYLSKAYAKMRALINAPAPREVPIQ